MKILDFNHQEMDFEIRKIVVEDDDGELGDDCRSILKKHGHKQLCTLLDGFTEEIMTIEGDLKKIAKEKVPNQPLAKFNPFLEQEKRIG